MKRARRRGEHVCDCPAYGFPHRFGGGRCRGTAAVDKVWDANYGAGECATCSQADSTDGPPECQVLTGRESVNAAPCWQDYVRVHEIKVYPPLRRE